MATLKIDVLETSFAIHAEEDEAYLNKLLGYYKEKAKQLESKTNLRDAHKIAVLTGIMLCDELYKEKNKNHANKPVVNNDELRIMGKITQKLIKDISEALDE